MRGFCVFQRILLLYLTDGSPAIATDAVGAFTAGTRWKKLGMIISPSNVYHLYT